MLVRLATRADAAAIATICNRGIQDRMGTFEADLRTETMADDKHPVVVVEQDDEITAYASSSPYRQRPYYAGIREEVNGLMRSLRSVLNHSVEHRTEAGHIGTSHPHIADKDGPQGIALLFKLFV